MPSVNHIFRYRLNAAIRPLIKVRKHEILYFLKFNLTVDKEALSELNVTKLQ